MKTKGIITEIKECVKKENKKIGEKAIKELLVYLKEGIKERVKRAAKRADFAGRKVIKVSDFSENRLD